MIIYCNRNVTKPLASVGLAKAAAGLLGLLRFIFFRLNPSRSVTERCFYVEHIHF